ncbi:MAG: hypothetical protein BroJett011_45960 [Chloroflexota bacterium]|nr:MAG: hypothetical protein BroJett011_45960 [Chloroflexota bacterium]
MKKDYMPVSSDDLAIPEISLVEDFWTANWQHRLGEIEARVTSVLHREEYRLMEPYLQKMLSGGRILDAGSGLGEWTIFLSQQGYNVYGVDISRQTINQLVDHFPQYHFICADIRRLDFPNGFFDACFSWGVFEHFEEGLGTCLTEARRVLKPGGYLFASIPFHNWRHIFRDSRPLHLWDGAYNPQCGYAKPMRFYQWRLTIPEFQRELAIHGFQILQMQPIHAQEGLKRMMSLDIRLSPGSRRYQVVESLLRKLIPARWICHMIMAVAQKST